MRTRLLARSISYPAAPILIVVFVLALGLRLWLAPLRGHVHDIEQFKAWVQTASAGNPLDVYSQSSANYPPLGLLPIIGAGYGYRFFFSPDFDLSSTTLTVLLKLPAIAADLLTAALLYHWGLRKNSRHVAVAMAAVYVLNPAVWYVSAWWGQLEALYTLPMLAAILLLVARRTGWSWVTLTIAVLTKPQAAVLAPILLIVSWRQGGVRAVLRGWVMAGLTAAIILLPLALAGQLPALWAQIQASAGKQYFLTMNAHNLWYLLTLGHGSFAARAGQPLLDNEPLVGALTGWQVGLLLFGVWTLVICWRLLRRTRPQPEHLFLAAAAMAFGFFLLPAEAHERYLFPVLALLTPLLSERSLYRWFYAGLSLTFILNLLWVDPAWPWPGFAEQLGWGIPIAAGNTVTGLAILLTIIFRQNDRLDPVSDP